jgi:hypothetical protein
MKLGGHASERTSKIKEENDHMARYIDQYRQYNILKNPKCRANNMNVI